MTNTSFIGEPLNSHPGSSLEPYIGYKVVGIANPVVGEPIKFFGPHYSKKELHYTNLGESRCGEEKRNSKVEHSFESCSCGFYVYDTYEKAFKHQQNHASSRYLSASHSLFIVKVALSGTVIICEDGARGSVMRITDIIVDSCWSCKEKAEDFLQHEAGGLLPVCSLHAQQYPKCLVKMSDVALASSLHGFSPVVINPLTHQEFLESTATTFVESNFSAQKLKWRTTLASAEEADNEEVLRGMVKDAQDAYERVALRKLEFGEGNE